MKLWTHAFLFLFIFLEVLMGCSGQKGEFLEAPSVGGSRSAKLAVLSADTNTRSVVLYNIDGSIDKVLHDYRTDLAVPRGLGILDQNNILVSTDAADQVSQITWDGAQAGAVSIFTVTNLNGAIYDMESRAGSNIYVLESNVIEMYDSTGANLGNISTTTGSCVLNSPRGMYLTTDSRLIVTNQGGTDNVLVYDVSTDTPTCLTSTAFGNNPYGVVLHSDGNLYVVTQGDDQVYRADADGANATVIFATDLSKLNNPTAIVELPNGNLAVASSGTDEVWEMDTSGNIIGTTPLIRDPLSLNISDMLVIPAIGSSN